MRLPNDERDAYSVQWPTRNQYWTADVRAGAVCWSFIDYLSRMQSVFIGAVFSTHISILEVCREALVTGDIILAASEFKIR